MLVDDHEGHEQDGEEPTVTQLLDQIAQLKQRLAYLQYKLHTTTSTVCKLECLFLCLLS